MKTNSHTVMQSKKNNKKCKQTMHYGSFFVFVCFYYLELKLFLIIIIFIFKHDTVWTHYENIKY